MSVGDVLHSKNYSKDTAVKGLLADRTKTFIVAMRVVGSDAGSSNGTTDNEKTVRFPEHQFST